MVLDAQHAVDQGRFPCPVMPQQCSDLPKNRQIEAGARVGAQVRGGGNMLEWHG